MGAAVTFIRALRVQRLLRFFKRARRMRIIFQTFIVTLPSLAGVACLLLLCLYVYSTLGMYLFADLEWQQNINYDANFQSFFIGMLTLLRCSTGESWNQVMADTRRQQSILFQCSYAPFDYSLYVANGCKFSNI